MSDALKQFVASMHAAAVHSKDAVMATHFMDGQKGMSTLASYARGGLKDLQDAVLQPFPDSAKQHEEMGMIASPTPQMVTESLRGREVDNNTDQMKQAKQQDKSVGMER